MPWLIDGYNLLHAVRRLPERMGPHGLHKARLGLLGSLSAAFGADAGTVTVVFDAAHAPPGAASEEEHQGIHVRYAVRHGEADALIEELIRFDSAPGKLTVVSDDHRIQHAARRRRCPAVGCLEFLEWLEGRRQQQRRASPQGAGKPEHVSAAETERWLKEFGDLGSDPKFREAFNPWDFDDDSPPTAPG